MPQRRMAAAYIQLGAPVESLTVDGMSRVIVTAVKAALSRLCPSALDMMRLRDRLRTGSAANISVRSPGCNS